MPSFSRVIAIKPENAVRLDRYICENLKLLNRSQIKSRNMSALIDGKAVKLSRRVSGGGLLELEWEDAAPQLVAGEDIPLDVLYEDEQVIAVNKRQGMVVHPGAGNHGGTLMNALIARRRLDALGAEDRRAFIVHRLDKDTSGVIICAYHYPALAFLASQFKARTVKKKYYAIVRGIPRAPRGLIDTYVRRDSRDRKKFAAHDSMGKRAVSRFRIIEKFPAAGGSYALLELRPETGRTHQLRVHMRYIGHPILGDPLYGHKDERFPEAALMLHARLLKIRLPGAENDSVFKAPLPSPFKTTLGVLKGMSAM